MKTAVTSLAVLALLALGWLVVAGLVSLAAAIIHPFLSALELLGAIS